MDGRKELALIRLPNLKTLEVFNGRHIGPTAEEPGQKSARHSNCDLWIGNMLAKLIQSCPNVESLSTAYGLAWDFDILGSYGEGLKGLKRVVGVHKDYIERGELRDTF
jgi:hypothetical protein